MDRHTYIRTDRQKNIKQLQQLSTYTLRRGLMRVPYSWKIWRGIKFEGLVVPPYNHQIKIRQIFFCAYVRMAIPYRTAKLKSANIFVMSVWDQTAKFNSCQYFRLYGILLTRRLELCLQACIMSSQHSDVVPIW